MALAQQFPLERPAWWRGEQWLVLAVFEDAWFCALGRGGTVTERDEALWWFADNKVWPFSFRHVCDILDLEPELVRRALTRQRSLPNRRVRFHSQKARHQAPL